ncbi:uncharacterized protein N7446_004419 [Penicillium canescens]|uniref:Uncharacterized protein n=1 Tax=Penicillium canescens TaxID=5083 RepID=A0AAD6I1X3_PENCN|nr:uncharacterized protein N7446_004419 [Penicillium canescens]KAJ6026977.1 hypothetical protein N7460_011794 [Penicillium canescens]KAJ6040262.1 hypothetical protein N7444_009167 [Penicillium canescens]KAJ6067382.1 hypothetical protein N7446_004419 [Penicillium canescens]
MAPTTFQLICLSRPIEPEVLASKVRDLHPHSQPTWVGKVHHWLLEPRLSAGALIGTGNIMTKWDYLLVGPKDIAEQLGLEIASSWSITANVADDAQKPEVVAEQLLAREPHLPSGWTAEDPSELEASFSPDDLKLSLTTRSRLLGSQKDMDGVTVKSFTQDFGSSHQGPVVVLNLLSYAPGKRLAYLEGYVAGFGRTVGPKYGSDAICFASGTTSWSSRLEEGSKDSNWEDVALVWYPSIWHFAKMLDDADYARLDREFKTGLLEDNPLLCCTEVKMVQGK